jgi:hypothetical protein
VECERREADQLTAVQEESGDHIQSILAENSFKATARFRHLQRQTAA